MLNLNLTDTIAAIATPIGDGGIGIVRLSGKDALAIADKIFISKDKKKSSEFKTYTTHYGVVADKAKIIDEVILTVMRSPRSYTKEDIIEINCHGGIVALRAVLDLVLANGARLAESGEFTRRAFLNGRIDLSQAEAVLDIIKAKTDSALKIGIQQLKGSLSLEINKIRKDLLEMLSALEANIDFPEEDLTAPGLQRIKHGLDEVNKKFSLLLDTSARGRIMREGIKVVICGKPNVGKSSLLNALLKQERSIVTPIAGTTRDTIEEIIDIKGIPVRIVDTAGILEPRDLIEKKAVLRSKKYISSADLVLILFDGSKRLSREDNVLISKLRNKTAIAIINKMDLRRKIDKNVISARFSHLIEISARKSKNIVLLEEAIANLVYKGKVAVSESVLVSNQRHIEALRHAQKLVAEAVKSLDNRLSAEFIAQGLKDSLIYLDELLGKKFSEDLLDKIFTEFCIGK